jgi:hypothetical protein
MFSGMHPAILDECHTMSRVFREKALQDASHSITFVAQYADSTNEHGTRLPAETEKTDYITNEELIPPVSIPLWHGMNQTSTNLQTWRRHSL